MDAARETDTETQKQRQSGEMQAGQRTTAEQTPERRQSDSHRGSPRGLLKGLVDQL